MPSRKAISRLVAISFTSTVLLSSTVARAATFRLSYPVKDDTTFSALLDSELVDGKFIDGGQNDDQHVIEVKALESVTLADSSGNLLEFDSANLANAKLALGGDSERSASATLDIHGQPSPFAALIYDNDEEDELRLKEAFSYNAYAFQKVNIPENSSAAAMLMAIAGMGIAIAKKRSRQQTAQ